MMSISESNERSGQETQPAGGSVGERLRLNQVVILKFAHSRRCALGSSVGGGGGGGRGVGGGGRDSRGGEPGDDEPPTNAK